MVRRCGSCRQRRTGNARQRPTRWPRRWRLRESFRHGSADVYVALLQAPSNGVFAYLRTTGNSAGVAREFQRLLASIDADVGFAATGPCLRFSSTACGANCWRGADRLRDRRGDLAWSIYGVIAYTVKQREREIAVRIAIGAIAKRSRDVHAPGLIVLGAGLSSASVERWARPRPVRAVFNVPLPIRW